MCSCYEGDLCDKRFKVCSISGMDTDISEGELVKSSLR